MKSPLLIVAELISGLIMGLIDSVIFVLSKFIELIISLLSISVLSTTGFVVAVLAGAGVFIFLTGFVFKSAKTLISLVIAFIAVIAVLAFFSVL